ncbi:MAG: hypothetical protein L6R42_011535, partial [Xanthoria sp. 1 TBL-2021]
MECTNSRQRQWVIADENSFTQVHTVDQALTFTSGVGKATINGKDQDVKAGDLMVVPAGTQHQFVNTGPTPL